MIYWSYIYSKKIKLYFTIFLIIDNITVVVTKINHLYSSSTTKFDE